MAGSQFVATCGENDVVLLAAPCDKFMSRSRRRTHNKGEGKAWIVTLRRVARRIGG
jgi:hypothetical protein